MWREKKSVWEKKAIVFSLPVLLMYALRGYLCKWQSSWLAWSKISDPRLNTHLSPIVFVNDLILMIIRNVNRMVRGQYAAGYKLSFEYRNRTIILLNQVFYSWELINNDGLFHFSSAGAEIEILSFESISKIIEIGAGTWKAWILITCHAHSITIRIDLKVKSVATLLLGYAIA